MLILQLVTRSGYSDNLSEILALRNVISLSSIRDSNATLTGSSNTSFVDSTSGESDVRYYAVGSYDGDTVNFTTTIYGKDNVTVNTEASIGHTLAGLSFNQSLALSDAIPSPNDGATVLRVKEGSTNEFESSVYLSFLGGWFGDFTTLDYGKGYYFDSFTTPVTFPSYGPV